LWWVIPPLVLLGLMMAGAAMTFAGLGDWGCSADRPLKFERDRWKADEIVLWARANGDWHDYYTELPPDLAPFAACGLVSVYSDSVFVAQWSGIPDDAGGFWFSPGRSPEGFDMWGMICHDPADLGDGWWRCGMAE
jgi:hypothetical protein